jgi:hypothetical protein
VKSKDGGQIKPPVRAAGPLTPRVEAAAGIRRRGRRRRRAVGFRPEMSDGGACEDELKIDE